jgi:hypothetical protein
MPDDHHPLMPRRNPEDIDLGAIKTDLEFLHRSSHAAPDPQGASPQTALRQGRECWDRHRVDRTVLAALSLSHTGLLERHSNRIPIRDCFHCYAVTAMKTRMGLAALACCVSLRDFLNVVIGKRASITHGPAWSRTPDHRSDTEHRRCRPQRPHISRSDANGCECQPSRSSALRTRRSQARHSENGARIMCSMMWDSRSRPPSETLRIGQVMLAALDGHNRLTRPVFSISSNSIPNPVSVVK